MRIYVAGPYTSETEEGRRENVRRAVEATVSLIGLGHIPFCPHLTGELDACATEIGQSISYEEWMRWDQEWLRLCDGFLYLAPSPGADRELLIAQMLGLKIGCSVEEFEANADA